MFRHWEAQIDIVFGQRTIINTMLRALKTITLPIENHFSYLQCWRFFDLTCIVHHFIFNEGVNAGKIYISSYI